MEEVRPTQIPSRDLFFIMEGHASQGSHWGFMQEGKRDTHTYIYMYNNFPYTLWNDEITFPEEKKVFFFRNKLFQSKDSFEMGQLNKIRLKVYYARNLWGSPTIQYENMDTSVGVVLWQTLIHEAYEVIIMKGNSLYKILYLDLEKSSW